MIGAYYEIENSFEVIFSSLQGILHEKYDAIGISQEFSKLVGEQKVLLAYRLLEENNLLPKIKKLTKSDEASTERRKFGNDWFAKKDNDAALKNYNQCIALAESKTILALGYGNRSAVLFKKGLYKECIEDINRALCLNNDQSFQWKLKDRKINAQKGLVENPSQVEPFFTPPPKVTGKKNPLINCASDMIEMKYDSFMGRHIVAKKRILPGDVIAVEKPFAPVILFGHHLTHCYHCADLSYTLIPCPGCVYALFCSHSCLAAGWNLYHKYECEFIDRLDTLRLNKTQLIALRVSMFARPQYVMSLEWDSQPICLRAPIKSQKYEDIHKLCTNEHKRGPADKFRKSVVAAVFMHLLEKTPYFTDFQGLEVQEAQQLTARILYRHLQTASCNMHGLSKLQGNPTDGYKSVDYGAAAYAFLSMLNHSCSPNVVRHNHGTTTVLRAIRTINAGEQVFDNYGYHHAITLRLERREQLQSQYLFLCECPACVNDYPLYLSYENKDLDLDVDYDMLQKGDRFLSQNLQTRLVAKLQEYEDNLPETYPCILGIQEIIKQCYACLGNKHTVD